MLNPPCNGPSLRRTDLCPVANTVLEPRLGREAHRLGQRPHLLVAGVLYAALAEVCHVGAGHHAVRGLIELLSRPPLPIRAAVGLKEKFEPLSYVQRVTPSGSLRIIQDTMHCYVVFK